MLKNTYVHSTPLITAKINREPRAQQHRGSLFEIALYFHRLQRISFYLGALPHQNKNLHPPFHFATSVHKDVSERLKHINPSLYREVALVLEQNKQERHMRGGEATRQKYIQQKTCLNSDEK